MQSILQRWRRRWWRPNPQALAAYAGLKPMVVVTGGSEGIGLALARRFAAAGNDVMLLARHREPLEAAAQSIRNEFNVAAVAVPIDATSPEAIPAIEAALATQRAYADVLVNNAGAGLAGPFHGQAPEAIAQLLDLNVCALTLLSRHFLPGMRIRGRGGIINLASLGGYAPGPNQAVYYASKAYVLSFSEAIAAEVSGEGVRITAIAPGPVNTLFHARMGSENALYRSFVAPLSADGVAAAGYGGFALGLRVVVPGFLNPFFALAMRVLPHRIMIPFIGVLLKQRGASARDVGGQIRR
jgi:short-subunit dehydrogenase